MVDWWSGENINDFKGLDIDMAFLHAEVITDEMIGKNPEKIPMEKRKDVFDNPDKFNQA